MAERLGRHIKLKWDGAYIAAVKEKSMTVNGEAVDVTSDDDDGYRKLLTTSGTRSLDMSISGIFKDTQLLDDLMADAALEQLDIEFYTEAGALEFTISGDFRLNSIEKSGATADPVQFSAELQSTGVFTKTAA